MLPSFHPPLPKQESVHFLAASGLSSCLVGRTRPSASLARARNKDIIDHAHHVLIVAGVCVFVPDKRNCQLAI
jgi:hypothetical protein